MSDSSVKLTPAIDKLEGISKTSDVFECTAMIRDGNGDEYKLTLVTSTWYVTAYPMAATAKVPDSSAPKDKPNTERPFLQRQYRGARPGKSWFSTGEKEYSFAQSMIALATGLPDAELLIDSITVKARGSSTKGPDLKNAAIAAWCEAIGIEVPCT